MDCQVLPWRRAFCISLEDSGLIGALLSTAWLPSPVLRLLLLCGQRRPLRPSCLCLEREVDQYSNKMDVYWKSRADARGWDSVRADLEVYALAGEQVTEDTRRTEAYRDL